MTFSFPFVRSSAPSWLARSTVLLQTYVWPQRIKACALAFLLLAGIGLQLAVPLILRHFIDLAVDHRALEALGATALAYLLAALVARAVAVTEDYVAKDMAWTATNQLRADVAVHCLRLDMAFHHQHSPGEMIERIDGDAGKLANLFSRFVVAVLGNALLFAGMLVVLLRIDLRMGIVLAACAAIYLLAVARMGSLLTPAFTAARQASARLFGYLEERLSGTEDTRANGATEYLLHCLVGVLDERLRAERCAAIIDANVSGVRITLATVLTVVTFAFITYLYKSGALSIGTAYLIFAYTQRLLEPLKEMTGQLGDFQQAMASMARIAALLETRSPIVDGPGTPLAPGALSVSFEHVSFGYGVGPPVLHDLSFHLAPTMVLGVLGRTGSGKTTLTRLLFRLYDPTSGSVRLGGTDLRLARVEDVRQRVALVTQEVQLFHATLRDNLTVFDAGISDAAILAALAELGLAEWYASLPQRLDTIVTAGRLSAGQAQLLALTRAFLADPSVVILDEASSRLDPVTEALLNRAISGLLRGRTGIIIAHRLSTVARADEILILDSGHCVEYGLRATLAADASSRFSKLLRRGLTEEVRS